MSHDTDDWNALLGVMAEGVLRVDASHVVVDANPAAARLLARPLDQLLGARLAELGDRTGLELVPVRGAADGALYLLRAPRRADAELQRDIGQDLHDGVGQLLTGMLYLAQGLANAAPPQHAASARRLAELAGEASRQVRELARGLSPFDLAEDELVELLRDLAADTQALYHIDCSFHTDGRIAIDDPQIRTQLYLIAREAISNAVQHGKATHLHLELARRGETHELSIRDEGRGFSPDDVRLGIGLRSMQSRARQIGGTLEVVSREPSGTTVSCRW